MADLTNIERLRRGDLVGAHTVRLAGSDLTEVPDEIFGLADTLEVLDLSDNALTALPKDLGRLHRLRVLFCSGNSFKELPPVLGDCAALEQIGCRNSGVESVPPEALPGRLRWLTLTDNLISELPGALSERPALQKLLLAGNRLQSLPSALSGASALELLRIGANSLEAFPAWLTELPRLAWLNWAGNPFEASCGPIAGKIIPWHSVVLGPLIGQGTSGKIYQATWSDPAVGDRPVAVKLFKDAMTSDGLPAHEMAACVAAGDHPSLIGSLGRLEGRPKGEDGLVMPLAPAHWAPLAGPPSLASCSRDTYPADLRLSWEVASSIAGAVGEALLHLHSKRIVHGDVYAHNTLWDGAAGQAVLSDLGAASFVPSRADSAGLFALDVLAWSHLLTELISLCDPGQAPQHIVALAEQAGAADVRSRPRLAEALEQLRSPPLTPPHRSRPPRRGSARRAA